MDGVQNFLTNTLAVVWIVFIKKNNCFYFLSKTCLFTLSSEFLAASIPHTLLTFPTLLPCINPSNLDSTNNLRLYYQTIFFPFETCVKVAHW